jgi:putative ABC transport system permease protein
LGVVRGAPFNLSLGEKPEQIAGDYLTPGFLDQLIGDRPFMGRYFTPEEGVAGKDHVAIITHKLWQGYFASDPNIIGKQIHLNGELYTVIGVQPQGQPDRQIVVPFVFSPEQMNHDVRWLVVLGRLKPGITLAQANADMASVTRHLAEVYPKSNKGWGASVEPLKNDFLDPDVRTGLWFLLGAVGFVLLIACVNVANLLLARGATRQKEVAVRASVGASRGRIFVQFLIESLALAASGGVLGLGLAWALLKTIMAMMPRGMLLSEADVRLNLPVLLFTLATTMLAGVLFGCAPAWQATRLDLNEALKEGGRSATFNWKGASFTFPFAAVLVSAWPCAPCTAHRNAKTASNAVAIAWYRQPGILKLSTDCVSDVASLAIGEVEREKKSCATEVQFHLPGDCEARLDPWTRSVSLCRCSFL